MVTSFQRIHCIFYLFLAIFSDGTSTRVFKIPVSNCSQFVFRVIAHSSVHHLGKRIPRMESHHNTTYLIWGPKDSVMPNRYAHNFAKQTFHLYNRTMKVYILPPETFTTYFDTIWDLQNKARVSFRRKTNLGSFPFVPPRTLCAPSYRDII